jgi:tetratricopeptide (TPR) repeat protein
VLVAFGLRLTYVLQLRSSPGFEHPHMDELYHDEWAQAIAAGETFIEGPYFRAPLYPAFLGAIYAAFGQDYLTPRVIQALLGSLSCGLLFLVGRAVFGRAVGSVAGFVAASYWMLIYFDGELLIPTLIVFLDLLLIWLLLRAAGAPGKLAFGLAGVALGLSAIARPNILLFAPAIVVWLFVTYRERRQRALKYVVCVTVGCLLVILPITVRNYVVGNDLVLIASQGGVNLYIGNNPLSDGQTAIVPGTPGDWWGGYYATIARAEQARGRKLKPSEVSRYYFAEAWGFIRGQPAKFLALTGHKLSLFWSWWEIANNKNIYFTTRRFTPIVRLLPLGFGVIGPLGIVGLVLCWRRRGELFPLWGFVLVYMVSVVMFFCTARYRMPVLPPLILLATNAVFQGVTAAARARFKPLLGGLVVLALATVLVTVGSGARGARVDGMSYLGLGRAYEEQGRLDRAVEAYREALKLEPDYLMARFNLGTVLGRMRRYPEAIAELRRALVTPRDLMRGETEGTVASIHNNLANVLLESGALAEAVEHYQAAIKLYGSDVEGDTAFNAQFNLGRALDALGRPAEAVDAFEAALRADPDNPNALHGLGRALSRQGRYGEALVPLRRCLRLKPDHVGALDSLSKTLIYFGRFDEVDELLRGALPLEDPRLVSRLAFLLATCPDETLRDGAVALEYARKVCPDAETCGPERLDALAAALAETGRFDEAVDVARRALERARQSPLPADRELVEPIGERLELYESGQPYRLPRL